MKAIMLDSSYGKTIWEDLHRGCLKQWWMFRSVELPTGSTNDTFVQVAVNYDPRGPLNCDATAVVYDFDNGEEVGLFRLTEPPLNWWSEINAKLVAATTSAPTRLLTVADQLTNRMAVLLSKVFEEEDTWVRTGNEQQGTPDE